MKYDRLKELESYARDKEFVSLDELCQVFQKSKNTIRRDVAQLVDSGRLKKVYGGVIPPPAPAVVAFSERVVHQAEEKQEIGRKAAQFVKSGDSIFLDTGTTTVNMIPHLGQLHDVTILTNNLYVILACMERPNLNVITLGGQLNLETAAFSSQYCAIENLKNFNIRKAFMTATGISMEQGVTNTSSAEAAIKKNVVERSKECFLLADTTKFGHSALLTYASLDAFQTVVTNALPPADYGDYFRRHGINVVV